MRKKSTEFLVFFSRTPGDIQQLRAARDLVSRLQNRLLTEAYTNGGRAHIKPTFGFIELEHTYALVTCLVASSLGP